MLRLPDGMRERINESAARNGRSMNAEIVAILASAQDNGRAELASIPDGMLLDAVLARYGARVQIVISKDIAEQAGIVGT